MIEECCLVLFSAGWFGRVRGAALFWTVPLLAVFNVSVGLLFSFPVVVFFGVWFFYLVLP